MKSMNALRKMDAGLKQAFSKIRTEMEEHLEAINGNTNEIQACYEYMAELEAKMEKFGERLDEIQYALSPPVETQAISLTHREQEVFVVLYAASESLSAESVARRLGLTVQMVERYVHVMQQKGVPVLKDFVGGEVLYRLDGRFKDVQARENVVGITEALSVQLRDEHAI